MSLTDRQRADAAFFDRHWADLARGGLEWVVPPDEVLFRRDLGRSLRFALRRMGDLEGKRVLELGCGSGEYTVLLARRGAVVTAIDLAHQALAVTRRRAERNRVAGRVRVARMAAEALALPDRSFDWVVGFGLLHHAQVERVAQESRRLLRPGGRGLFREPLGLNPLLEFARRRLPYPKKVRAPGDRFLREDDLAALQAAFPRYRLTPFYLLSMVTRAVGGGEGMPLLARLDDLLLRRFPSLWRWCRYVVIEVAV